MSTHRFREITAKATRKGKCRVCGKATTRSRTFLMTVSPFNLNEDGVPRTAVEVVEAVYAKAKEWAPAADVFTHDKCLDVAS